MAQPRRLMRDDLLRAAVARRRVSFEVARRAELSRTADLQGLLARPPVLLQSPPSSNPIPALTRRLFWNLNSSCNVAQAATSIGSQPAWPGLPRAP